MTKLTVEEVVQAILKEREYQTNKWGSIEEHPQSIPGYMIIMEKELEEAKDGWNKNIQGRDSALSEIIQVAAVAVACLQQHGLEGN